MEDEDIQSRIQMNRKKVPFGIRFLQSLSQWIRLQPLRQKDRDTLYRVHIFVLTFIAYASYHLSRKPISIVKETLNANCSLTNNTGCTAWPPFGGLNAHDHGETLLGYLDFAFLGAYALGMYGSGYIAEHSNIRYFLTFGMVLSGAFSILFGLGFYLKIHHLSFFIIVQLFAGLAQSTGWPAVVEAIGNWFGKGQRGLIMGIWNSHTSVGNIAGSAVAAVWSDDKWGMSFIVPGFMIIGAGILVFLFLVLDPSHVGCTPPQHHLSHDQQQNEDERSLLNPSISTNGETKPHAVIPRVRRGEHGADSRAISFWRAFLLPGVLEYSFCLFFAKLVSYTFLYWLPYYISNTVIGGVKRDSDDAGDFSIYFDVGGIIGGILAGVISDYTHCSGITCTVMLVLAGPSLYVYRFFGNKSVAVNTVLMILSGILVNGPYGLITTAVSANLGTQRVLRGDTKAMATVTAIIDGTGSIGAAIGPLLTSIISANSNANSKDGWDNVFYMLITSSMLAALLLVRQVVFEFQRHVLRTPTPVTTESPPM